ncbi:CIC_collapsed_G0027330.mRNA.1.CDS.1 [Saccharomyces cerevisiae]|nr:CIC_collapsed_G0027330.mRNA.1.CDS.1 [Saccharomyces cerevisiae]
MRDLLFSLAAMCVMSYVSLMNQVTVLNCLLTGVSFMPFIYLIISAETPDETAADTSLRENSVSPFG